MTQKRRSSFNLIWGVFMVIAYMGIAYLALFTPILIQYNGGTNTADGDENLFIRIILGIILLVYGVFRGYRVWWRIRN